MKKKESNLSPKKPNCILPFPAVAAPPCDGEEGPLFPILMSLPLLLPFLLDFFLPLFPTASLLSSSYLWLSWLLVVAFSGVSGEGLTMVVHVDGFFVAWFPSSFRSAGTPSPHRIAGPRCSSSFPLCCRCCCGSVYTFIVASGVVVACAPASLFPLFILAISCRRRHQLSSLPSLISLIATRIDPPRRQTVSPFCLLLRRH